MLSLDAGPQTKTLTIVRGDGGPLDPRLLCFRHSGATAELRVIEPGEHYEIDITFYPPWESGRHSNSIELATGVPEQPECRVWLRVATLPE